MSSWNIFAKSPEPSKYDLSISDSIAIHGLFPLSTERKKTQGRSRSLENSPDLKAVVASLLVSSWRFVVVVRSSQTMNHVKEKS